MLYGWYFLAYHVLLLVLVSVVSYFSAVLYGWYIFVGVAAGCLFGLSCLVIVFPGCLFAVVFLLFGSSGWLLVFCWSVQFVVVIISVCFVIGGSIVGWWCLVFAGVVSFVSHITGD